MIVMLSGPDKRIGFSKDVKKFLNKELKNYIENNIFPEYERIVILW